MLLKFSAQSRVSFSKWKWTHLIEEWNRESSGVPLVYKVLFVVCLVADAVGHDTENKPEVIAVVVHVYRLRKFG